MKVSILCFSLLLMFLCPCLVYSQDENIVAYWNFDEGVGETAADSSGNGNDGTLNGGVEWTEGAIGNALLFNGIDGYVEVPDSDSLHVVDFTIEAWVKVESEPAMWDDLIGGHGSGGIIYKHNEYQWVVVGAGHQGAGFDGVLWVGLWGAKMLSEFNFSEHLGEWRHTAITFEDASQETRIYVDGELDSEGVVAEHADPSTYRLLIGARLEDVSNYPGGGVMHGSLDEIKISDVVRTEEEIAQAAVMPVEPLGKLSATWGSIKGGY